MYFEIQYQVGNAVGFVHSSLIYHDHDKDFFFLYNIFDHNIVILLRVLQII